MTPALYIITGSCGTGKSTLIPYLKKLFPSFAVHDFDDVGVPESPTPEWQRATTKHWLQIAGKNAAESRSTIICGLIIPHQVKEFHDKVTPIHFCLLDIIPEERARRLKNRNASQELIEDLEEVFGLREWVPASGFPFKVIDTSTLSPKQVTLNLEQWIRETEKNNE